MVKPVSEYRREEILGATYTALKKHGLTGVSYDLIAEEAETSRQLIRHYYPDVETLMADIVETVTEQFQSLVMGNVVSNNVTERLSTIMDFFLGQTTVEDSPPSTSFDSLFALAAGSKRVQEAMKNTHQVLADTFATELMITYPQLSPRERGELGYLFVCAVTGHWRMLSSLGFEEHYSSSARAAMDTIIKAYTNIITKTNNKDSNQSSNLADKEDDDG